MSWDRCLKLKLKLRINLDSSHVRRLGRRFPILLQPLCWETTCQAHSLKAKQVAIWWQQKATLIGSTYQIETEAEAFSRKLSTLPEIWGEIEQLDLFWRLTPQCNFLSEFWHVLLVRNISGILLDFSLSVFRFPWHRLMSAGRSMHFTIFQDFIHLNSDQNPCCLLYLGDHITQF